MKKLLVTGVSAIALSFGAFGAANATHSLSSNLGEGFLDIMGDGIDGQFNEIGGVWTNFAVNTGDVDGSITNVSIGLVTGDDINGNTADQVTGGGIAGHMSTTVVGALNEGHIASVEHEQSSEFSVFAVSAASHNIQGPKLSEEASSFSAFGLSASEFDGPEAGRFRRQLRLQQRRS